MKTLAILFAGAAVIAIALTGGCKVDRRPCMQSHQEEVTTIVPILIGMTNNTPQYMYMPQTDVETVCDRYGPEPTK